MNIDHTDRAIIKLLRHNARISVTKLAEHLGVSRLTANKRLSALHKYGVIRKFTIETDMEHDDDAVYAISMLKVDGIKIDAVQRALPIMPGVATLHTTNGMWDLVARTHSRNLAEFDQLLCDLGKIKGVESVETCLLLRRLI